MNGQRFVTTSHTDKWSRPSPWNLGFSGFYLGPSDETETKITAFSHPLNCSLAKLPDDTKVNRSWLLCLSGWDKGIWAEFGDPEALAPVYVDRLQRLSRKWEVLQLPKVVRGWLRHLLTHRTSVLVRVLQSFAPLSPSSFLTKPSHKTSSKENACDTKQFNELFCYAYWKRKWNL